MTILTIVAVLATLALLYVARGLVQEMRSPTDDTFRTPLGRLDALLTVLFVLAGIGYIWAARVDVPGWFNIVLRVTVVSALAVALVHLVVMARAGRAKQKPET